MAYNDEGDAGRRECVHELLTSELKNALALVDIRVLDHFIVGDTAVMSFAERGLI